MMNDKLFVLRVVRPDMTSRAPSGFPHLNNTPAFKYPESGLVECPDWEDSDSCGRGLHGWLWGDASVAGEVPWGDGARWLVVEVLATTIVDLDGKVERTRSRPIPSGQVTATQAAIFMIAQALVGLAVLLQFNLYTIMTGLASLLVVAIYPFMKRVTYWPQIFLGLAFSWGALMGWPAALGQLDAAAFVLYAGSIAWVIGYDTIYAHQDREDDMMIGIKSTALLFGQNTPAMLTVFYTIAVVLIGIAGVMAGGSWIFMLGLLAFAVHLSWQVVTIDIDDPAHCLKLFRANRDAGLILFLAMVLDSVF